ncbi:MAG: dephospho-CoA kinase [Anaeromyxobacter sp.]|nr:dephospho-CoA kinase [Anaeromyxobacter sp.]MBL0274967.1 dephospho-CoA kinase [Anaeromyxobacter sp.]
MRLVGLTGGIATGKSTFAAALRALGAPVVDADALARQVVAPGAPALAEVARAFGPGVLQADGTLDRQALGALVFADPAARRRLEAITHPAIRQAMLAETARLAAAGHDLAFYDAPLLFEVGLDQAMALVVVVFAPPEAQLARLAARDGLSRAQAEARLAAQLPVAEKAARADVVVDNADERAPLGPKAAALLADLRAGLGRRLPSAPPRRY